MDHCLCDIESIKTDFKKVIHYSQFEETPQIPLNIDDIFDQWYSQKHFFMKHFNNNLIYESDEIIHFELDSDAKNEKFENFKDNIADLTDRHPSSVIHYAILNFLDFLSAQEFYNNKTETEWTYDTDFKIPKGMKIVKALKFFITNEEILKDVQTEASMLIQENVISGKFCMSVHPLDFLSVSENACNWRSCHALDGSYRVGNLNYMLDDSTIICYLKTDNATKLPRFPEDVSWNSKKWRMLLFFSNDRNMIYAGRQYPFFTFQGLDVVKNFLKKQHLGKFSTWHDGFIQKCVDSDGSAFHVPPMVPVGDTAISPNVLIQDGNLTYHYNDLLRSTCYTARYAYRLDDWFFSDGTGETNKNTRFHIGKPCYCLSCGKDYIQNSDVMLCPDCKKKWGYRSEDDDDYDDEDDMIECCECGNSIWPEDAYFLPYSNISICETCFRNLRNDGSIIKCNRCNVYDFSAYIEKSEDGKCFCPDCQRIEYKGHRVKGEVII